MTLPAPNSRTALSEMSGRNGPAVPLVIRDRQSSIAVRAVAQGKGPDARVREAMTADVKYCFEDEDLDDVVRSMGEQKVRRLPVMSRDQRLVGIVSLGDVAVYADSKQTDAAVSAVSEPGGPHTQSG